MLIKMSEERVDIPDLTRKIGLEIGSISWLSLIHMDESLQSIFVLTGSAADNGSTPDDLDFICADSPAVQEFLVKYGFSRSRATRNYVNRSVVRVFECEKIHVQIIRREHFDERIRKLRVFHDLMAELSVYPSKEDRAKILELIVRGV